MKSLVIYNKYASKKRAANLIEPITNAFSNHNITPEFVFSDSAEQATRYIAEIDLTSFDNIISVGGDGTLFQVVNACMQKDPAERIPIGQIPLGTGNAFCRDIGLIPNDYETAITAIKKGRTKKIDLGRFSTNGTSYYFSNIVGFGFVTDVAQTANKLKTLGKMSYTLGVLYHVAFLKPFTATIEYDGKKIEREVIFIEISNTRYTGSDFIMAPNAKIDDGLFDITILKKTSRLKILRSLPKIFTGSHIHLDVIETFRTSEINIKTENPKTLTPDGEILGSTPINVKCVPKSIDFIALQKN